MNKFRAIKKHFMGKLVDEFFLPPYQPFGPDFGVTIYPEYVNKGTLHKLRETFVDTYTRQSSEVVQSDGRLQLPPINPSSFLEVLDRMEDEGFVPPGYLNNQTINLYQPGNYLRAHIDNMFVYDDLFMILSYGAPQMIKFIHAQNGEELECVIPECCVYTIQGPARYVYFHMLLPVETQRLSVVLRRSILNSSGTFRTVCPEMKGVMPWKANSILDAMLKKSIGVPRCDVDLEWLEKENLGPFDTATWVKTLKPLRDWSLQSQLDEDEIRLKEMVEKGWIEDDFSWRVKQLRKVFRQVEEDITINKESLDPLPNK